MSSKTAMRNKDILNQSKQGKTLWYEFLCENIIIINKILNYPTTAKIQQ